MGKIGAIFEIGRRSLGSSQTALQTVGHNIANKNTKGYSRQRVEMQSSTPGGIGKVRIGNGAFTSRVSRVNNPQIEKQILFEGTRLGFSKGRAEPLAQLEQIYNEQANKGLNQYISEFFNSVREFSNNPESIASRSLVKETAVSLATDFGRMDRQLSQVQKDIDQKILTKVSQVNQYVKEVAQLNKRIQFVEVSGSQANDERDRRDQVLKELGELINISTADEGDGKITVNSNGVTLVSGLTAMSLKATPSGRRNSVLDIYYYPTKDSTPTVMTEHMKGGEIGGLLQIRDEVVAEQLAKIDELAYNISTKINEAHREGYDRHGRKAGNFFNQLTTQANAAKNIKVTSEVFNDVGRIAGAANPNSAADNTIANIMSSLQYQGVLDNGKTTFDDYYNSMVGEVGIVSQRANKALEAQNQIMGQLRNIRESVSGVSVDEEATKLIEYQRMFDASAKMIKTADEMLETVINIKR